MSSQTTVAEQSLLRWYIDTRHITAASSSLPLVETLQLDDQETVQKYLRLADRHMSLASYLLKYLFIHRTCRIPWNEISISRTPKPHRRPCFIPTSRTRADGSLVPNVEFNISHQASLVALAGCIIPMSGGSSAPFKEEEDDNDDDEEDIPQATLFTTPQPSSAPVPSVPQVGIDITCTDEPTRRSRDNTPKTAQALSEFVNIFSEVFTTKELDTIKQLSHSTTNATDLEAVIKSRMRLFYAYWALKEAYIKMTGEALLAPWLRQLEFTNVVAPSPSPSLDSGDSEEGKEVWSEPYRGVQTWLYGRIVEDVRIELVAFESDYLVATAARGGVLGSQCSTSDDNEDDPWRRIERIDIERDITPCARGSCHCLD